MREVLCLVDNSVAQRMSRSGAIQEAYRRLVQTYTVASCLPQILEEGYSARKRDYQSIMQFNLTAKVFLPPVPEIAVAAMDLQREFVAAGRGREIGVTDLQIAATALHYSTAEREVRVVHYDADFEAASEVLPELTTQWIVPRGSIA